MKLEGKFCQKRGLITKKDCTSVGDLNQTVKYICHVVDVCSKLHKDFHDYCLFSESGQYFVGIVFVASDWETTKTYFCVTAWPLSSTLASRSHSTNKNGLNAQHQSLHDCKIPQQTCENWQINCVFRPFLGSCTQIMECEYKQAYKMIETGVLVWKSKNMKPYHSICFALVAICLKLYDELMCLTASLNLNA